MSKAIDDDSDLPDALNTAAKQEKRAKELAAAVLGKKARRVAAPNVQGFYSRTRIVTMVGGEKIVIQFRVEPLAVKCFERARSALGDVVPSIQHVKDDELESLDITTYAMSYMPGQVWVRINRSKIENRAAIAASLGGILARGLVQNDSSAVVDDYILPALHAIRDSLDSSTKALAPHVDRLIASAPSTRHLPLWISHHDLNEVNVLVDEQNQVSGLVDWEFSRDLPFGMGLHRVCDTIAGENFQGKLELPPGHDVVEAKFWDSMWDNLPKETRSTIEGNLESFGAAINIGSLLFACLDVEASVDAPVVDLPKGRQLSFLEAALTYRPPHVRGERDGAFAASFMTG